VALVASPLGGPPSQVHPIGAMTVASYLQTKLDGQVEVKVLNFGSSQASRARSKACLSELAPAVVGFPIYSSHVHEVISWARELRELLPAAVFVAGGPHVTLSWPGFVRRWGSVFDFAVCGDGETPMLAIVEGALAGDFTAARAAPGVGWLDGEDVRVNPSAAPLPVHDWTDPFRCEVLSDGQPLVFTDRRDGRLRRAVALVSSRSCPQKCSFCAIIAMPGSWRAAETSTLVGWLAREHQREPFEHVYFMDANFFVSADRVRELIAALSARLPDVSWSTSSTVGFLLGMSQDMPWLVEHGLRAVEIGIESGSPEQLRFLNKRVSIERNRQAVELVQRHRLELGLDFIMFYPDQTVAQLKENLTFLREARLLDEEYFDHYTNALELYPGTPLRSEFERRAGAPFDADELPDPDDLFADPQVHRVYRAFLHDFVPRHLPVIRSRISELRRFAADATADPAARQLARLQIFLLRHVPYKVLWRLCEDETATTAEQALPWLTERSFEADAVLGLADPPPSQLAELSPEPVG
jgi:radical SAM superfamily enzyme YgiQ (UPF0313 family)